MDSDWWSSRFWEWRPVSNNKIKDYIFIEWLNNNVPKNIIKKYSIKKWIESYEKERNKVYFDKVS